MNLPDRMRDLDLKKLILPIVLFIVFIGVAIGIINYQQQKARQTNVPKLEVTGPEDGSSTQDAQIVIEGKTDPGDTVKVSGSEVPVDTKGQFAVEVPVNEGENSIGIVAQNGAGKTTEKNVRVTRVAASPEAVPGATNPNNSTAPANGKLSTSGPEDFWLIGATSLAASISLWQLSRRKLSLAILS